MKYRGKQRSDPALRPIKWDNIKRDNTPRRWDIIGGKRIRAVNILGSPQNDALSMLTKRGKALKRRD